MLPQPPATSSRLGVNAGARLDRLPVSRFHRRLFALVGFGMFFDGFDIYIAASVLSATVATGFSTLAQNAAFISATFAGMMLGAFVTGFLGDHRGRRYTYQLNLAVFGLASLLAAFAPTMPALIVLRFFMGVGLGAENVVGYSTLTEFLPPATRGRWLGFLSVLVVSGLPASSLIAWIVVPTLGWRAMFLIGGVGSLAVWAARRRMPESPRWLVSVGRLDEADRLVSAVEAEVAGEHGALPPPRPPAPDLHHAGIHHERSVGILFRAPLFGRLVLGCICLITMNALLYGFITWLPTFLVQEGLSITRSFGYTLVMALGAPAGSLAAALNVDRWGRRATVIGASLLAIVFGAIYPFTHDAVLLPVVGLCLTAPVYVLITVLYGIFIPEMFPTSVRLRASGICSTIGRGASVVTPFIVLPLYLSHGIAGVLALMIGLLAIMIVAVATLGVELSGQALERTV
jgi:putative MFS transporter